MKPDIDELDWKLVEIQADISEMKEQQNRIESILKGRDPDVSDKDRILGTLDDLERKMKRAEHEIEKISVFQDVLAKMINQAREEARAIINEEGIE